MSFIKDAWNKVRLDYQNRYYKKHKQLESAGNYGGTDHGAMLEMSYVLHEIFGLTDRQVEEVEHDGFTHEDMEVED